jgi:hypothetical protein
VREAAGGGAAVGADGREAAAVVHLPHAEHRPLVLRAPARPRVAADEPRAVGRPQDEADGVRHVGVGVLAHGGVLLRPHHRGAVRPADRQQQAAAALHGWRPAEAARVHSRSLALEHDVHVRLAILLDDLHGAVVQRHREQQRLVLGTGPGEVEGTLAFGRAYRQRREERRARPAGACKRRVGRAVAATGDAEGAVVE